MPTDRKKRKMFLNLLNKCSHNAHIRKTKSNGNVGSKIQKELGYVATF